MSSLIIADQEFVQAAQQLYNIAEQLRLLIERYQTTITQLDASGMNSDAISASLGEHMSEVNAVIDTLVLAVDPLCEQVQVFIEDIDDIDDFLY